jgi:hypothetical protein
MLPDRAMVANLARILAKFGILAYPKNCTVEKLCVP